MTTLKRVLPPLAWSAIAVACASFLSLSRTSGAESPLLSLAADDHQIVERTMDSARY
jgi:hypothetical protein